MFVITQLLKTPWAFGHAVAAPASARVILFLRFGLSMGFHVFYTVVQVDPFRV